MLSEPSLPFMAGRRKNTAIVEDIVKVLRGSLPLGLKDKRYYEADPDKIAEHYETVMVDLLYVTARPQGTMLKEAAAQAWQETSVSEAAMWSNRICEAYSHCSNKLKNMVSGQKLPAATKRIALVIQKVRDQSIGESLRARALRIQLSPLQQPKATPGLKLKAQAASPQAAPKRKSVCDLEAIARLHGGEYKAAHDDAYGDDVFSAPPSQEDEEAEAVYVPASQDEVTLDKICAQDEVVLQNLDTARLVLTRMYASGLEKDAEMRPGPQGFCIASFGSDSEDIETEMPNLMLQSVMRKPAATEKTLKRPAAAADAEDGDAEDGDAGAEEEDGDTGAEDAVPAVPRTEMHRILKTHALTHNERIYITGCIWKDGDHRNTLLVSFSRRQYGSMYKTHGMTALKTIIDKKMSYEGARNYKADCFGEDVA